MASAAAAGDEDGGVNRRVRDCGGGGRSGVGVWVGRGVGGLRMRDG